MTRRTLEALKPRLTLEELEGRTQFRTPGLWRVAPTSDYPPGEKPGINIDAGEHGADGFVCEVCGPNPDEQMRADAYFIAHAPDLLAIAQGQREEIARLKANASTAAFDKVNDQLREANAENEKLRKQIADDNEMAKKAYGY